MRLRFVSEVVTLSHLVSAAVVCASVALTACGSGGNGEGLSGPEALWRNYDVGR
jgi:hypothetical protein